MPRTQSNQQEVQKEEAKVSVLEFLRGLKPITDSVSKELVEDLSKVMEPVFQAFDGCFAHLVSESIGHLKADQPDKGPGLDTLRQYLMEANEEIAGDEEVKRALAITLYSHIIREVFPDEEPIVSWPENISPDIQESALNYIIPLRRALVSEAITAAFKKLARELRKPLPKLPPAFLNGVGVIPSPAALETMLQGFQDAAEGASNWTDFEGTTTPTYRHLVGRKGKEGIVDLSVRRQDGEALVGDTILTALWDQVRELDDLTGDVLLAAVTQWLSQPEEGSTWITADAILDYRGIKPKTNVDERGHRRRAGHHLEHRAAVAQAFEQLDHLWLNIDNVEVIELDGKRRKPRRLYMESKAISISDRISQGGLGGGHMPIAWHYRPGEWVQPFLQEGFRQTALLAQQSLRYDPYREAWEKRLSRYFAFHWRIQAHQGNYEQPYRVGTLLKAIAMEPNEERPNRTRERLEKALDRLQHDGVIACWEYKKGYEEALPTKGWLPIWLKWTVLVAPSPEVIRHYTSITQASHKPRATLTKGQEQRQ